ARPSRAPATRPRPRSARSERTRVRPSSRARRTRTPPSRTPMTIQTPLAWLTSAVTRAISVVISLLCSPTDIPSCRLWLRASSGVTKTGDLVTQWADKAGNHTFAAPSIVERPRFVAHSTALHQRPAIRFDGDGDLLEKEGGIDLPFEMNPFSAFVVLS